MVKRGNTKHQKLLKSEKAKVKLKGKELPKGTNITKTNFKIKKIVIREQLKASENDELLKFKNLNVKELLVRLNHFNTSAKNDAINGLKHLLTSTSEVLENHIDQLIRGVVPLILDVEKTVRRESYKLLHTILQSSTSENLEPFFEILLSYLRCAMTHINQAIQEDSLLFLDVLLISTPLHVVASYQSVMPNFIDMISKLRIDSKPGRMLTVNLNSKMTSVRWRVKVLSRLHQFLSIMINSHKDYLKRNVHDIALSNAKTVFYTQVKPFHNLFDDSYTTSCLLPCFSSQRNTVSELNDSEAFHSYIDVLLPLLFETWLEVGPGENKIGTIKNESTLSDETADLLGNILEVIQLLLKQVQYLSDKTKMDKLMIEFILRAKNSFVQHILLHFPFNRSKRGLGKMNKSEYNKDEKMLIENLTVCYIFISLNKNEVAQEDHAKAILQYLKANLNTHSDDTHVQRKYMSILETLFVSDIHIWAKSSQHLESLLNEMLQFYDNENMSDNLRQQYFSLFCNVFLDTKHQQLCNLNSFQKWLQKLPSILHSERVTVQTIQILSKFAIQCNEQFSESLRGQIQSIILNLPKIHKSFEDDKNAQYRLLGLLYWIRSWDTGSLNLLQTQLANNEYGKNDNFILEILQIKTR